MNRKINNKVHLSSHSWPRVRSSIVERVKEAITLLFIFAVFSMWLIIVNV